MGVEMGSTAAVELWRWRYEQLDARQCCRSAGAPIPRFVGVRALASRTCRPWELCAALGTLRLRLEGVPLMAAPVRGAHPSIVWRGNVRAARACDVGSSGSAHDTNLPVRRLETPAVSRERSALRASDRRYTSRILIPEFTRPSRGAVGSALLSPRSWSSTSRAGIRWPSSSVDSGRGSRESRAR